MTDAEVLQELLHRHVANDRRDAIGPAFEALLGVVDAVLPIEIDDVQRARNLLSHHSLQARDALHAAIMQRHGISQILTFDQSFDSIPSVTRLS